ncbi:MAG TPA: hypothetical protein VKV04_01220 [Verrucomicrobiae bacterium]|nr:hypothetical protein [Verrucomicrobiae bacterium]
MNNFPRNTQHSGWPKLSDVFTPTHLKFLGEQNDPADDKLKNFFRHIYSQAKSKIVRRAYLARISYGDPPMQTVVLCERQSESIEEVLLLGPSRHMFGEISRRGDFYDRMLICEEQERELRKVCHPFYEAA